MGKPRDMVVRTFQRRLLAYMALRAPHPAQAEDLAQDVFVVAYESLARFEPGRDFGAWLFGIAAHRLGRAWREQNARQRGLVGLGETTRDELAQWAASSEHEREDVALVALDECLRELPDSWRQLVAWHYDDGLSLRQMAERRGSASSTVGVLLHRARRRLRDCIAPRLAERRS